MNVILLSFTPRHWSGGVNRWINDFMSARNDCIHYSAADIPGWKPGSCTEWDAAKTLSAYLKSTRKVDKDDVIIVDGFWGLGLESYPNVISVAHGIWSHLTCEDVANGMEPDFPVHHSIQLDYRKKLQQRGGKIVSVSNFIQYQLLNQFNINSTVINNAIDLDVYKPLEKHAKLPLIIHGVNDKGNTNKGWSHIQHIKNQLHLQTEYKILSLDEANVLHGSEPKQNTLSRAWAVVIPSAYEGNSYFCLESLACNVPVVAYDVGLPFTACHEDEYGNYSENNSFKSDTQVGIVMDRKERSPEKTYSSLMSLMFSSRGRSPNHWVSKYSIQNFHLEWNNFLKEQYGI